MLNIRIFGGVPPVLHQGVGVHISIHLTGAVRLHTSVVDIPASDEVVGL